METILRYGTPEQKETWLETAAGGGDPVVFAMTEPDVASSDATNVASRIVRDGDEYVISGRKWYTTGATDPRCKIIIFMGQTDPDGADRHKRQSMILVPKDAPGVRVVRSLPVLGFYGVPDRASEVVLSPMCAFPWPISCSARAGASRSRRGVSDPGASIIACVSSAQREGAGAHVPPRGEARRLRPRGVRPDGDAERIAEARIMIEQARLLTLKAA